MKKILFTLAALTFLTASLASQATAGPKSGQPSRSTSQPARFASNAKFQPANHFQPAKTTTNAQFVTPSKATSAKVNNYHLTKGTKFSQGYFYQGKNHSHWTCHRWDARYGCTCYFDPCCSCWYYWCEIDICYYPVTYCPHQVYSGTVPAPMATATTPVLPGTLQPGLTVEPIEGTLAPPITPNSLPPIPDPVAPAPKQ